MMTAADWLAAMKAAEEAFDAAQELLETLSTRGRPRLVVEGVQLARVDDDGRLEIGGVPAKDVPALRAWLAEAYPEPLPAPGLTICDERVLNDWQKGEMRKLGVQLVRDYEKPHGYGPRCAVLGCNAPTADRGTCCEEHLR